MTGLPRPKDWSGWKTIITTWTTINGNSDAFETGELRVEERIVVSGPTLHSLHRRFG